MNAIVIRKSDKVLEDEELHHVIYKNGPYVYWEESLSKEDVQALRAVCDFLLREVYE